MRIIKIYCFSQIMYIILLVLIHLKRLDYYLNIVDLAKPNRIHTPARTLFFHPKKPLAFMLSSAAHGIDKVKPLSP